MDPHMWHIQNSRICVFNRRHAQLLLIARESPDVRVGYEVYFPPAQQCVAVYFADYTRRKVN